MQSLITRKRLFFWRKVISAVLSIVLFSTQCVFANAPESLFYERRQKQIQLAQNKPAPSFFWDPLSRSIHSPLSNHPEKNAFSSSSLTEPRILLSLDQIDSQKRSRLKSLIESVSATSGHVREISGPLKNPHAKIVFHIQDVHQNSEAQNNISSAISSLIKKNQANLIALEGADKEIKLQSFRTYPDQDAVREAADVLLRENKISGAAHAGFISEGFLPPLVGIEKFSLYQSNIEAYRQAAPHVSSLQSRFEKEGAQLFQEKTRIFNENLLQFDRQVEQFRSGQTPLGHFVRDLAERVSYVSNNTEIFLQAAALESDLDFDKAQTERALLLEQLTQKLTDQETNQILELSMAYRSGQINHADFYRSLKNLCDRHGIELKNFPTMNDYIQYTLLADGVNAALLTEDMRVMEKAVYESLVFSSIEKDLLQKSSILYLKNQLIHFSLTPSEWASYKAEARPFLIGEPTLRPFEMFYEVAEQRNEAMAKNLLREMEKQKASVAVLVTGGFHTEGMGRWLNNKEVITLEFVPKITKVEKNSEVKYLSVFSQEKTPLDQLFEGQELFLANPPVSPSAEGIAAGMTVATSLSRGTVSFSVVKKWFIGVTGWVFTSYVKVGEKILLRWFVPKTGQVAAASFASGQLPQAVHAQSASMFGRPINSHVIAATLAVFSLCISHQPWITIPLVYILFKVILFLSVLLHEYSHLKADGQLRNHTFLTKMSKLLKTLHATKNSQASRKNRIKDVIFSFLKGTDIKNASVKSPNTDSVHVKKVASAGPFANLALTLIGFIISISAKIIFSEANDFRAGLIVVGMSLIVSNLALLALNFGGTDYKAWATGEHPNEYRFGPAPNESDYADISKEIIVERTTDWNSDALSAAKTDLLSVLAGFSLEEAKVALTSEFITEAVRKAQKRNAKKIIFQRFIEHNNLVFQIKDDGQEERESFDVKADAEKQGMIVTNKSEEDKRIAQIEIPLPVSPESIFRKPIDTIESWDAAHRELNSNFTSNNAFSVQLEKFLQSDNLDEIPIAYLLLYSMVPSDVIANLSLTLLQKRIPTGIDDKTADILAHIVKSITPSNTRNIKLTKLCTLGLLYFSPQNFDVKKALNPLSPDAINFRLIDNEEITTESGEKYKLVVSADSINEFSISAQPISRTWPILGLIPLFFRWVRRKLNNSSPLNQNKLATITFDFSLDQPTDSTFDLSNWLKQVRLPHSQSQLRASQKNLVLGIISHWAKSAPQETTLLFTVPAGFSPNRIIAALQEGGFEFKSASDTQFRFEKTKETPKIRADGQSQSVSANPVKFIGFLFLPLKKIVDFLDESFHLAFGAFFGLFIPIDWANTSFIGRDPHISVPPAAKISNLKAAWFSFSAPFAWTLILLAFISLQIFFNKDVGYKQLFISEDVNIKAWAAWTLGLSSFWMVIGNLGWKDPGTTKFWMLPDLEQAWLLWTDRARRQRNQRPLRVNSPSSFVVDLLTSAYLWCAKTIRKWLEKMEGDEAKRIMLRLLEDSEPGLGDLANPQNPTGIFIRELVKKNEEYLKQNGLSEEWAAASHNQGYWSEARNRVLQNDDIFIGADLNEKRQGFLTEEGRLIYQNRASQILNQVPSAHLLRLSHFRPEKILELYRSLGKEKAGAIAKHLIELKEADEHIVVDLFARKWDPSNLRDAMNSEPGIKEVAFNRQKKFLALALTIKGATQEILMTDESRTKILWKLMQATNFQETESLFFVALPFKSFTEEKDHALWKRYSHQLKEVNRVLPEYGRSNSPSGALGETILQLLAFAFAPGESANQSKPQQKPSSPSHQRQRPVSVVPGGGGNGFQGNLGVVGYSLNNNENNPTGRGDASSLTSNGNDTASGAGIGSNQSSNPFFGNTVIPNNNSGLGQNKKSLINSFSAISAAGNFVSATLNIARSIANKVFPSILNRGAASQNQTITQGNTETTSATNVPNTQRSQQSMASRRDVGAPSQSTMRSTDRRQLNNANLKLSQNQTDLTDRQSLSNSLRNLFGLVGITKSQSIENRKDLSQARFSSIQWLAFILVGIGVGANLVSARGLNFLPGIAALVFYSSAFVGGYLILVRLFSLSSNNVRDNKGAHSTSNSLTQNSDMPLRTNSFEQSTTAAISGSVNTEKIFPKLFTNPAFLKAVRVSVGEQNSSENSVTVDETTQTNDITKGKSYRTETQLETLADLSALELAVSVLMRLAPGKYPTVTDALEEIDHDNANVFAQQLVTELSKAIRSGIKSTPLATTLANRVPLRNDHLSENQDTKNEARNFSSPDFTQIRTTALVLRDAIIQEMKEWRSKNRRFDRTEIEILSAVLRNSSSLEHVILQSEKEKTRQPKTIRLDPESTSVSKQKIQPEEKSNTLENDELGSTQDLLLRNPSISSEEAFLSTVLGAGRVISTRNNWTIDDTIRQIATDSLSPNDQLILAALLLAKENGQKLGSAEPANIVLASVVPLPELATINNLLTKAKDVAALLSQEILKMKDQLAIYGQDIAEERTTVGSRLRPLNRFFRNQAQLIATGITLILGFSLGYFSTEIMNVINHFSLDHAEALASLGPLGLFALRHSPQSGESAGGSTPPDENALERLASDIVRMARTADLRRTLPIQSIGPRSSRKINLAQLLPEIKSLGVGDGILSTDQLIGLSSDQITLLEQKIQSFLDKKLGPQGMTLLEAKQLLGWLLLQGKKVEELGQSLGEKNLVLAIKGGSELRYRELENANKILSKIKAGQKLFLAVPQREAEFDFFSRELEEKINEGRVVLVKGSVFNYSVPSGQLQIDLEKLINILSQQLEFQVPEGEKKEKAQAAFQNLVVLIPPGSTWLEANWGANSPVNWIGGFALLKDFLNGVMIQHVDVKNLDRLARLISSQS